MCGVLCIVLCNVMYIRGMTSTVSAGTEARIIHPSDLVDAATVAGMLGLDRSTVTRRAKAGTLPYVVQVSSGAYIFDKGDIRRAVES